MLRPINSLFGSLTVVIGIIYGHTSSQLESHQLLYHLILGFLTYLFICSASMVVNDVYDFKIDSINRPGRPIPRGDVSGKETLILAILLYALGITISFFHGYFLSCIGLFTPFFAIMFALLGYAYALRGKNLVWIKNLIVGISCSFGFFYGRLLVFPNIPLGLVIFFLSSVFLLMAREVIKDMEDLKGDKLVKPRTIPSIYGLKFASIFAIVNNMLTVICFLVIIFLLNPNLLKLVIFLIIILFIFRSTYFLTENYNDIDMQGRSSLNLKIASFLGLIAFLLISV